MRALAEDGPARSGWDGIGEVREDPEAIARHLDQSSRSRSRRRPDPGARLHGRPGLRPGRRRHLIPAPARTARRPVHRDQPRDRRPVPPGARADSREPGRPGRLVRETGAAVGLAVDPDVDRLALVDETGPADRGGLHPGPRGAGGARRRGGGRSARQGARSAAATPPVVANLSTSLVVEDAAREAGARFVRAPVGEANVARDDRRGKGRHRRGGEWRGHPPRAAHRPGRPSGRGTDLAIFGRDGTAALSEWWPAAPRYRIVKAKAPRGGDLEALYAGAPRPVRRREADARDGLRLAWTDRWVHVRPSGTEPIIRFIAEAPPRRG